MDKPILFSSPMVRAILAGTKTMTRRVIKPQPVMHDFGIRGAIDLQPAFVEGCHKTTYKAVGVEVFNQGGTGSVEAPFYRGQRLWVRETWAVSPFLNRVKPSDLDPATQIVYRASYQNDSHFVWRPSIFMPRWASRITLEITHVRVERLQEITAADCLKEGFAQEIAEIRSIEKGWTLGRVMTESDESLIAKGQEWFQDLWDGLNAKRGFSWESNPFVWVVQFKKVEGK